MSFRKHLLVSVATGILLLSACHRHFYVHQHNERFYEVKGNTVDSSLVNMLAPYKSNLTGQMEVIIGHADTTLTKAQPESTLGNFLADAQLEAARSADPHVAAAVANYGGIRIPYLSAGAITMGKMYELMPFDNTVVIVDMPGDVMKRFCDHIARAKGWPVSGLKFDIVGKEARRIYIGGKPLDENHLYKIAVNDYMANGGDNCDFLVPLKKETTTILIRDALITYVKDLEQQHKPLHPKLENRLQYGD